MKRLYLLMIMFMLMCLFNFPSYAKRNSEEKKAIVIASFGTSYPEALVSITSIYEQVKEAFPDFRVKMAFTSNIIRNIWQKRVKDHNFLKDHPGLPQEILHIKSPLATISDLQDQGYRTIIVQPTHIYAGEEYMDLISCVNALNSITTIKPKYRPFKRLILGRPLLGKWGSNHDYHRDIEAVAEALKDHISKAKSMEAALVYMGHGNEFFSTGAYVEFQEIMRKKYPDVPIFVGTVEGFPSLEDVLFGLTHMKIKKVLLKPFMIVAGDHARNDMAGDEKDSWKSQITSRGIRVSTDLKGLGQEPGIVKIFIQHIKDAAKDGGVNL